MATNLEETTVAAFSDYAAPKDLERHDSIGDHLDNTTVRSLSWYDVSVVVRDRKTKQPISILSAANGFVEAGQVVALMGPSGSGKTTLLNVLAHRTTANTQIQGEVMINNERASLTAMRNLSSYVEQEDALIGSLTVKETINFAARLALPSWVTKKERIERVNDLLDAFGIQRQANALVGTPIRKGISGGQKRRLSVASQLIADPRILFLDEPTSGLDSTASFEVMNYIKRIAVQHRLIVVASIHQPSTATFALFDQLMLLSGGKTCYFGPMAGLKDYFDSISHPIPAYTNPAEFLLELVNVDFAKDKELSCSRLESVHSAWTESTQAAQTKSHLEARVRQTPDLEKSSNLDHKVQRRNVGLVTVVLLHRSWIKSYRDIIAYGIRIAMYTGLAIMASHSSRFRARRLTSSRWEQSGFAFPPTNHQSSHSLMPYSSAARS
jgi:ABC-type multidrug transport system ATPase subunit